MDDWPKPELLYALTPFEVAAGLRTPSDAAALLRALEVDELAPLAAGLADTGADPGADPGADLGPLALAAVLEWPKTPARSSPRSRPPAAGWARPAAPTRTLPPRSSGSPPMVLGDIGVVALLLMRYAVLQPGQAVFMPPAACTPTCAAPASNCSPTPTTWSAPGLTSKHIDGLCPNSSSSSTPRSRSPCSPRAPSRTASPPSTPLPPNSAST